jgi:hypothetical protein
MDMFKCALHQVFVSLITYLAWNILSSQQLWYYFLNCVYPNPPCQLSCERKPEKTHDFRQSVGWLVFTVCRQRDGIGERRLLWRLTKHANKKTHIFWASLNSALLGVLISVCNMIGQLRVQAFHDQKSHRKMAMSLSIHCLTSWAQSKIFTPFLLYQN